MKLGIVVAEKTFRAQFNVVSEGILVLYFRPYPVRPVVHFFQCVAQGVVESDDVREDLFLTGENMAVDQGFSQIEKSTAVRI